MRSFSYVSCFIETISPLLQSGVALLSSLFGLSIIKFGIYLVLSWLSFAAFLSLIAANRSSIVLFLYFSFLLSCYIFFVSKTAMSFTDVFESLGEFNFIIYNIFVFFV